MKDYDRGQNFKEWKGNGLRGAVDRVLSLILEESKKKVKEWRQSQQSSWSTFASDSRKVRLFAAKYIQKKIKEWRQSRQSSWPTFVRKHLRKWHKRWASCRAAEKYWQQDRAWLMTLVWNLWKRIVEFVKISPISVNLNFSCKRCRQNISLRTFSSLQTYLIYCIELIVQYAMCGGDDDDDDNEDDDCVWPEWGR